MEDPVDWSARSDDDTGRTAGSRERTDRGDEERGADADGDAFDPAAFEAVAGSMPVPVLVVDEDGAVATANDRFRGEFGLEDITGQRLETLCRSLTVATLETHCSADGEQARLDATARGGDGIDRSVRLTVERRAGPERDWFVAVLADVTGVQSRVHELERYERIVETIDDGVYVLDDAFEIVSVNDAVSELTGYSRSELLGANASLLASEETLRQAAAVSAALQSGEEKAATITTTLETADGRSLPVETRFSVYQLGDGSYGQVGVVRDISDRVRHEETLRALHDSTRELLRAETPEAVSDVVVDATTEVIDLSQAVVYLFDRTENVLRSAAATGDCCQNRPTDVSVVEVGGGPAWEAFVSGERRSETDEEGTADSGSGCDVHVPLGDHGVFSVAAGDEEENGLDRDTLQLVELLAASAETALERVDREHRLKDRDRELREQNEELRRLERTNEVIRRIDRALVGVDSREGVQSAVCEGLVDSELCSFAWVGRSDGEAVVPEAWAGTGRGYLDGVDRSLDGAGGPPSVQTARSGDPTVVSSVASDIGAGWRREALAREFGSTISVPLTHDGTTLGVLTAYADEPGDFRESLVSVFLELGDTIANAIRVADTKQWLSADGVVEVDLAVESPTCPLAALADRAGATLVHEGTVDGDGDGSRTFVAVVDAPVDSVEAAVADRTAITGFDRLSEDEAVVELELAAPTVPTTLTDLGARIQSLTVSPDGVDATVELAPGASVRDLVDALDTQYGSAELLARQDRTEPATSRGGFREAVEDALTDRQLETVRTAYLSGFFDWPRATTGEEIADSLGVSQPTVNRHLRVGERKILDRLFED